MPIRGKLLILLLAIALVPLGVVSWMQYHSLDELGRELGLGARRSLLDRAERAMLQLAEDYGTIVRRGAETIEVVLQAQAREAERCLAAPPPEYPQITWAEDFDRGVNLPEGVTLSERHFVTNDAGERQALLVTYEQQALTLAPGVDGDTVAASLARLSLMTSAYQYLRHGYPGLIHWQYTALAEGIHSSYPGHGGYPEDYDPRVRPWYLRALRTGALTWNAPIVDASTRQVILPVSMPIHEPDGSVAGVTGVDVELLALVQTVRVPAAWSDNARTMIVMPTSEVDDQAVEQPPGDVPGLVVVAQQSYLQGDRSWDVPIKLELVESADEAQMRAMVEDMQARRAGIRHMPYQGADCVWAYGSVDDEGGAYLLIVVPYADIVAEAIQAEANVRQRTRRQYQTAAVSLAVMAAVVVLLAAFGSRTVTRPVAQLAEVARRIAAGDFKVRAQIETSDELGQLGRTVNEMIPQLADRMELRQSLAIAMEVQQNLLPGDPPTIAGLDIAGKSIYCDETGGDYYDFLEFAELGPRCLGVAVGDVTGHGIAAALLMATGRALLRSRATKPGSLATIMSDINRQLSADTAGGRFMTLVYLLVDMENRSLRWVCAGHDPPITYDPATGKFGELAGGGIPLGIEAGWAYEEHRDPVPPTGHIIVIGTDGIWEARNPSGDMFGKDAFRRVIRDNADRSAEQISRAVTDALAAFRHTSAQHDDVTLVVIKIEPHSNTTAQRPRVTK